MGGFRVADDDSIFRFTKFKMADLLWRPKTSGKSKFSKNQAIWTKFGKREDFQGFFIRIQYQFHQIQDGGPNHNYTICLEFILIEVFSIEINTSKFYH